MKNLFLVTVTLISALAFAQAPDKFEALESTAGAPIEIVKASEYNIGFSGDESILDNIVWEVEDNTLKISSDGGEGNYEGVTITVYTPSLSAISISNGGSIVMDEKFSRMKSFVVSAEDGATVDLSKIDFNTLVVTSGKDSSVLYKAANTFVRTNSKYGVVKRMQN